MAKGWRREAQRHAIASVGARTRRKVSTKLRPVRIDYRAEITPIPMTEFNYEKNFSNIYDTIPDFFIGLKYPDIFKSSFCISYMRVLIAQLKQYKTDNELHAATLAGLLMAQKNIEQTVIALINDSKLNQKERLLVKTTLYKILEIIEALNVNADTKSELMNLYKHLYEEFNTDKYLMDNYKGQLRTEIDLVEKYYPKRELEKEKLHPITALWMFIAASKKKDIVGIFPIFAYSMKDILLKEPETKEDRILKSLYEYLLMLDVKKSRYEFNLSHEEIIVDSKNAGSKYSPKLDTIYATPLHVMDIVLNNERIREILDKHSSMNAKDYTEIDDDKELKHIIKYLNGVLIGNYYSRGPRPIDYILFSNGNIDYKMKLLVVISNSGDALMFPYIGKYRSDVMSRIEVAVSDAIMSAVKGKPMTDSLTVPNKYYPYYEVSYNITKDIMQKRKKLLGHYKNNDYNSIKKVVNGIVERRVEEITKKYSFDNGVKKDDLIDDIKRFFDMSETMTEKAIEIADAPKRYIKSSIDLLNTNKIRNTKPDEYSEKLSMNIIMESHRRMVINALLKSNYFKKLSDKHKSELMYILTEYDNDIASVIVGALLYGIEGPKIFKEGGGKK